MADHADNADDLIEKEKDAGVKQAAKAAAEIPVGIPGECEYCGEHFERLVKSACGRCRDTFKLG